MFRNLLFVLLFVVTSLAADTAPVLGTIEIAPTGISQNITNFDEGNLTSDIQKDIPNTSVANVTYDSLNNQLLLEANASTDMWASRNGAPIAWVAEPDANATWYVETKVSLNTAQTGQVAGITFFSVDGERPEFTFGFDNWTSSLVHLQGLGDNNPNISVSAGGYSSVYLRVEVTKAGAANDLYTFKYRFNAGDPWSTLAADQSLLAQTRIGLVYKTNGAKDGAAFSYLDYPKLESFKNEDFSDYNVTLSATDDQNDSVTYAAKSLDTSKATVSVSGDQLTIHSVPNANGVVTIDVNVTQDSNTSLYDTQSYSLKIVSVNDAPVLTQTANHTKTEDFTPFNIELNATDIEGDTLTYSADSNDTNIVSLSVSGSTLSVTPVANANGVVRITTQVSDGSAGDAKTFDLNVTAVYDKPTFSLENNLTDPDSNLTISLGDYISNPDNSSLTYYVENNDSSLATTTISGTNLLVSPVANTSGVLSVTAAIYDGDNNVSTTFQVTIDSAPVLETTALPKQAGGSSWADLGTAGFSAGSSYYTSLAFDSNNTPYVAYKDIANSSKATVMKFNGSSWVNVGTAGFSAGSASYTSLAFDSNNTPYVAYQDSANGSKATVMKFNGTSWVGVGTAGFSAGGVQYTSLAFDGNNTPYVAYQDYANSYKATLMKFNGTSWVGVGTAGFSAGTAYSTSLAFDGNNIPYVAYEDNANSNKATVMKFGEFISYANVAENQTAVIDLNASDVEGNDINFSISGTDAALFNIDSATGVLSFKTAPDYEAPSDAGADNTYDINVTVTDSFGASSTQLMQVVVTNVNDNAPVLTSIADQSVNEDSNDLNISINATDADGNTLNYSVDSNNTSIATVSVNGTTLTVSPVANANGTVQITVTASDGNLSTTSSFDLNITAVNDAPVLDRTIFSSSGSVTSWADLGTLGAVGYSSLAVDTNGIVYVGYKDTNNADKATVMKYIDSNSSWVNVGSTGFSAGTVNDMALEFDGNNTLYMAYSDGSNSNKATLMKYVDSNNSWVNVGTNDLSVGQARYISLAFNSENIPFVAFSDSNSSSKATVMKYIDTNSSWMSVGSAGFTPDYIYNTSLAIDSNDTLYVAYRDGANSAKASVMKYVDSNSSWVNVGSAGFSAGFVGSTSLAIDSNNMPYVAYADGNNSSKATVMKYNGSSWETVGSAGFSGNEIYEISLAIDSTDTPYVIYGGLYDYAIYMKANVMKYNGSSWENVGAADISTGTAGDPALVFGGNSNLYILYTDSGNSNEVTVKKFDESVYYVNSSENQTSVVSLNASDVDNNTVTYSISGSDAALFNVDSATGVLSFKTAPDYEAPSDAGVDNIYNLNVTATDSQGALDTQAIEVVVTNVNDNAPVLTTIADQSINEGAGDLNITLSATDADGDSLTYSVDSANSILATVTVSGNSLNIHPTATGESKITVTVSDGTNSLSKSFVLTVVPSVDSDNDGISDADEVSIYKTSPTSTDSDGDGVSDAVESQNGNDPTTADLAIAPTMHLFGSTSGSKEFVVTNPTDSNITIGTAALKGTNADQFSISTNGCDGTTLTKDQNCSVTVSYPASSSAISAYLSVNNVDAFLHNNETVSEESARRLPPVIGSINIDETMNTGTDYNITWSIVGYDSSYISYVAFFKCTSDVPVGECGASYGTANMFDSALNVAPYLIEQSSWSYKTEVANEFHFSYVFSPKASDFADTDTRIVIRFYYKSDRDILANTKSSSILIPGNLANDYYDTSGRKIAKTIHKN